MTIEPAIFQAHSHGAGLLDVVGPTGTALAFTLLLAPLSAAWGGAPLHSTDAKS